MHEQIIERFEKFQQETGKYPGLNLSDVEFEVKRLSEGLVSFPGVSRVKGGVDISIKNFNLLSEDEKKDYTPLVSGTVENNQISGYIKNERLSDANKSSLPKLDKN